MSGKIRVIWCSKKILKQKGNHKNFNLIRVDTIFCLCILSSTDGRCRWTVAPRLTFFRRCLRACLACRHARALADGLGSLRWSLCLHGSLVLAVEHWDRWTVWPQIDSVCRWKFHRLKNGKFLNFLLKFASILILTQLFSV